VVLGLKVETLTKPDLTLDASDQDEGQARTLADLDATRRRHRTRGYRRV
jgi:hypothetical protein